MPRRWRGVLVVENSQTGDGRFIDAGAIEWADLPLPLAWLVNGDQHIDMASEAPVIGNIDSIERVGDEVRGEGVIDDATEAGAEAIRMMETGTAPNGERFFVSIDADDWEIELVDTRPPEEGDEDEDMEVVIVATGHGALPLSPLLRSDAVRADRARARVAAAGDEMPEEGEVVMEDSADSLIEKATRLRIRGATLCAISAFAEAYVELAGSAQADDGGDEPLLPAPQEAVAACAGPVDPPADWFADPQLSQPQRHVTVTDDGRIFGHLATFGECHIGYQDVCVSPEQLRSASGYGYFRTGTVRTREGALVATGAITLRGGHADAHADPRSAAAHYDDTHSAVADVVVGEDEHGLWFSGALRPGVTEHDVRALRASGVSGDWRRIGTAHELIAVCSVNTPGFPKVTLRTNVAASGAVQLDGFSAVGGRPQADPDCDCADDELWLEGALGTSERLAAVERGLARLAPIRADAARRRVQPMRPLGSDAVASEG